MNGIPISLVNWPPFRDNALMLPRFTVIVGQNGVGKSRVIEAVNLVSPVSYWNNHPEALPELQAFCKRAQRIPRTPVTIAISNADSGLHPKMQIKMIAAWTRLVEDYPDIMLVAVCYSPYMVDSVSLKEVLVVAHDGQQASCKFLSEHPDAERFRGSMGTGEFWSSVGEEWVLAEKKACEVCEDAGHPQTCSDGEVRNRCPKHVWFPLSEPK